MTTFEAPDTDTRPKLPFVTQDESGDVYFAEGHVSDALFVAAVLLDIVENVGVTEAKEVGRDLAVDDAIRHVWWRFDDPGNDEHMARCGPSDEGALAFTEFECR